jgi:hypothetical protein
MLRKLSCQIALAAVLVVSLAGPAAASAPSHPLVGLYRSSSISGTKLEFRVSKGICPPDERGGEQHQKKGYCFVPLKFPTPATPCPGGLVYNDEEYDLFTTLIPSSGKLKSPLTSSSGAAGEFRIAIGKHGGATGYLELLTLHDAPESEVLEKCPSGRIAFTAKRVG